AAVPSRTAGPALVTFVAGRAALASRNTLTPPYSAARGPTGMVPAPSAARIAMCRPALEAATLVTTGRLSAVKRATAGALFSARQSAAMSQAHHSAASRISAAATP